MTDTMGTLWMLVFVAACLVAVSDWRKAVFLGILVDVVRDPVRKLIVGKPIWVTLSGAALWLLIVVVATVMARGALKRMLQTYPRLRTAFLLLIFAMIPAAVISIVTQPQGLPL